MKKTPSVFSLVLFLLISLVGCGTTAGNTAETSYDLTAAMEDMLKTAPIEEAMELSETDLTTFFGIEPDWVETFAVTICGMGISADEYILITAKDEDAVKSIEEKLSDRLSSRRSEFETYLPEEFAILEKAKVETFGRTVTLIVSENRDDLLSILETHKAA